MPTIVTSENLDAFNAERLPKSDPVVSPDDKPAEKVEAKAEPEAPKTDETKEAKPDEAAAKRARLDSRFSELTKQRKDAQDEAKRERDRADAAEARARELEAKLNPPKVENDGKPDPTKYADPFKYAEDLAEWTADKKIKDAQKAEAEAKKARHLEERTESWKTRVEAFEKETPDYAEVLSSSTLAVHDAVRDAIMESDLGPAILYALASDDGLAEKFKIPLVSSREEQGEAVRKQLRALGRLEAKLEKQEEPKVEKKVDETPRAPDPITPVKGTARGDGPPTSGGAAAYRAWREAQMNGHRH